MSESSPTAPQIVSRASHPLQRKTITLFVVEEDFSGALAYALHRALEMPAFVDAVRVGPGDSRARVDPPIPVSAIDGDLSAAVAVLTSRADLAVVQHPAESHEAATRRAIIAIRGEARCLLVEVDGEGEVVQASGPHGWFYSAVQPTRPAERCNETVRLSGARDPGPARTRARSMTRRQAPDGWASP